MLLGLGVLVTPVMGMLALKAYASSVTGVDVVPSVLLGCGIGLLLMGGWRGWLFLSRSGEAFELYEGGLVHSYRDTRRVVRWDDVTGLNDYSKDTALARVFGGDVSIRLKLRQGKPVHINGIVERAEHLTMKIREAVGTS